MKKHAVLVGINGYKRLGQLRYARQDAEAVADALKRCYGFSDDEITLLTDESTVPPEDQFTIKNALSPDFYAKDLDLFVFGFWGHGIWEDDNRYLCPMNVWDNNLKDTALPLKVVQESLSNIRAKNICLILDCCQNEVSIEGRSAAQAMTSGEETSLDLLARDVVLHLKENTEDPSYDPTVVVLNSCKKGERAFESVERQHGLFTAELLEAMEKRCKSTSELCEYVRDNVPKALRVSGVHQTPYYTCAGGSDIVLPAIQKGYDVFLSYRHEGGSVLAKLIQTQLESRNLRVFLDIDEFKAGNTFDEELLTRIEQSTCFVPVLSPGCFGQKDAMSDGDWIYKEMIHAVRQHKPIVPVFAPGFEWGHESVPRRVEWLSKVNGIAYHPVYVNAFLDCLAETVHQPGNLNHEAILEQMTATVEELPATVEELPATVEELPATVEELPREEESALKQKRFEAVHRVERKKWAIGGIIAGVILLGITLGALVMNTGNQGKATNAPAAVEEPAPVMMVTVPDDVSTLTEAYEKIAPGGTITVLPGRYDVPETITITKDVTIIGDVDHPEYVVLQGGEESVFHLQSGFAEIGGLTIQNEGKEGSSSAYNDAVQFSAPLGALHDCVFTSINGCGFVVNTKDSNPNVKNCTAQNCGISGFYIGSGATGTFTNCTASRNGHSGMAVRNAQSNPTVEDCKFTDGKSAGIAVLAGAGGTFTKCTASGNALAGMEVRDAQSNPTVEDCQFTDGKGAGIIVHSGASGTFRNCTASENAYSGMMVHDEQSNPTVEDCTFEKNRGSGVYVYDGASGTFRGNKLSGNVWQNKIKNWDVSGTASDLVREGNTPNR